MSREKKKIYLILPSISRGGAERVMIHLANNLSRDLFDVTMVILNRKENSYEFLDESKTKLIVLNIPRARKAATALLKLLRKEQADIVLSTSVQINLILGLLRKFLPKKTRFIARESSIPSKRIHSLKPIVYKTLYNFGFRQFDKIIAQSDAMAKDLSENFNIPSRSIKVINNPIENDKIVNHNMDPDTVFDIVMVANLNKQKAIDRFIESLAKVRKTYKAAIIGEGNQRLYLEELIENLELQTKITLLGFKKDPIAYVKKAKVVALTSMYEGFPNVLLEAITTGTPIIAFDGPGGTKEIISNTNGLLIENNNLNEFAKGIEYLLEEPLDRGHIQAKAVAKYGMKKIISEYEKTILNIE